MDLLLLIAVSFGPGNAFRLQGLQLPAQPATVPAGNDNETSVDQELLKVAQERGITRNPGNANGGALESALRKVARSASNEQKNARLHVKPDEVTQSW